LCGTVGTVIGCPISGYLLTHYKQRRILLGAVIGNTVGCFWFALAGPEHTALGKWNLFGAKFLIGMTQSAILIYSPVWVDEFAPEGHETMWMSILQASVASQFTSDLSLRLRFTDLI
jgi:MFS family permease